MESDVYSYGMVVWHLFSRQLPWGGKRMTDPQIMRLTVMNKKVSVYPSQSPTHTEMYNHTHTHSLSLSLALTLSLSRSLSPQRPTMPPTTDCPKLFEVLINQCWDEDFKVSIYNTIHHSVRVC